MYIQKNSGLASLYHIYWSFWKSDFKWLVFAHKRKHKRRGQFHKLLHQSFIARFLLNYLNGLLFEWWSEYQKICPLFSCLVSNRNWASELRMIWIVLHKSPLFRCSLIRNPTCSYVFAFSVNGSAYFIFSWRSASWTMFFLRS